MRVNCRKGRVQFQAASGLRPGVIRGRQMNGFADSRFLCDDDINVE